MEWNGIGRLAWRGVAYNGGAWDSPNSGVVSTLALTKSLSTLLPSSMSKWKVTIIMINICRHGGGGGWRPVVVAGGGGGGGGGDGVGGGCGDDG